MLLGVAFALEPRWEWFIPSGFLFFPILFRDSALTGRLALALLLAISSATFIKIHYHFPDMPEEGFTGKAYFEIHSLGKSHSHIGSRWIYKGTITAFEHHGRTVAKNIPLIISINDTATITRPSANQSYIISGTLKQKDKGFYSLILSKNDPWIEIPNTYSSAEWRFHAKQWIKEYINNQIPNEQSATFLSGLATGEFDDKYMAHELGRFGLQHIMAISGFHFSIIAGILSLLFRLILPQRSTPLFLMFLLSSYFLFLGTSASILRAWIAIVLAFSSQLFQRRANGLNSLGIGLILVLMVDPLMIRGIGFQFSFAVTAAILLLYGICDSAIESLVDKKGLFHTRLMNRLEQHGYMILQSARQGFALTMAVNLVAFPILLYHFHKFPLMSLIFNLFFPFLVSISMLLLLLGPIIPLLHLVNSHYTGAVLSLTYKMPPAVDLYWRMESLPLGFVLLYLSSLFVASIYARSYFMERNLIEKESLLI